MRDNPYTEPLVAVGASRSGEVLPMLDPTFLQNLTHSKIMSDLLRQLTQLNPDLTVEAVLPLVAARLVGADASDQGTDPLQLDDEPLAI